MRRIRVVAVGSPDRGLIEKASAALSRELRAPYYGSFRTLDPSFAFHPERRQYHSTLLLEQLTRAGTDGELIIGISEVDLYIPILTFVFGEAQLSGHCALVSYHRLRQEFYGLPGDHSLLVDRLIKETVHEAGHTLGLSHCDDHECVMASSHSVEWIDLKSWQYCPTCRDAARLSA